MNSNSGYRNIKVLYIASASRSGSTILEHSLGRRVGVCNCGELRRLKDFYNENINAISDPKNRQGCTCGAKFRDCKFWLDVEEESQLDFSKLIISSQLGAVNRALFKLFFFLFGPNTIRWVSSIYRPFREEMEAAENCFRLYQAIAKVNNCHVIVDSSKMIHQFLMLKVLRPDVVKLIALVRDGRAVSKSMVRGERQSQLEKQKNIKNNSYHKVLKVAIQSWVISILQLIVFFIRVDKKDRYFIKYESICSDSETVLNNIAKKFNIDIPVSDAPYKLFHTVGGSPARFGENFKKITIDEGWKKDWQDDDARIFRWYGGFVNWILGYK